VKEAVKVEGKEKRKEVLVMSARARSPAEGLHLLLQLLLLELAKPCGGGSRLCGMSVVVFAAFIKSLPGWCALT
jgi:hypothetical protein